MKTKSDRPSHPLDAAKRLLDAGEPTLQQLASATGLSASHLQRSFRERHGLSPAQYLAQRKLMTLKTQLRKGGDVSAALYDAGYGSPSRVYEAGAARLGMTPARYRDGGRGEVIRWCLIDTALGIALVATTQRGICMIELMPGVDAAGGSADTNNAAEAKLRREFPAAQLQRVDAGRDAFLQPRVQAVADALAGRAGAGSPPALHLIGTAFQNRVWDALMRIPKGETRSYAQLAADLGAPRAARAVARACASNRLAVMVPCHRVIRGDGTPGGYRWGLPLKSRLLQREAVDIRDAKSAPTSVASPPAASAMPAPA